MRRPASRFYEFGPFRLDEIERLLFRNGEAVPLKPKVFDTLLLLVQNSGHVLDKDELMKMLWPDTVVEENNLNQNVSALRRALGEIENADQYIETLPRRGYRFVASVRESGDASADLILEQHTLSSVLIEAEEHDDRTLETDSYLLLPVLPAVRRQGWATRKVLVSSVLVAALATAGYFLVFGNSKRSQPISAIKSIAVLPFKPLSSDGDDDYLGLGMTDALIMKLGGVNQIVVRPTSAVRKYGATEQDPIAAGRELSVESVMEGSIQKAGDRVRVTVQLMSVRDGRHLWAEKFDEKFTDILAVEDRISERVATALSLRLTDDDKKRLAQSHSNDPEAYQLFLKGRYFWNKRTDEGLKKSKEYFERAIARDPNYALAYGALSDYYMLVAGTEGPRNAIPKAREAAANALAIDGTLSEPHTVLGFIKWRYDFDWAGAESESIRAIDLNRNDELAHDRYAVMLSQMGRLDESLKEIRVAQQLDPLSLLINARIATILYRARDYDGALEQCLKTLELDDKFPVAHGTLALICEQTGKNEQAITEAKTTISISGRTVDNLAQLARAYSLAGEGAEARSILSEMKKLSKEEYVDPGAFALVHASLGEKDQAFEWLDTAIREHDLPIGLKSAPEWDVLRSDSRFQVVLQRFGLTP